MSSSRNSSPDFDILSESEESDCGVIVSQRTGSEVAIVGPLASSTIEQPPIHLSKSEFQSNEYYVNALVEQIISRVDEDLKISENPLKNENVIKQIGPKNETLKSRNRTQEGNNEGTLNVVQNQQNQAKVTETSWEFLLLGKADENPSLTVHLTKFQLQELLDKIKELENRQKMLEEILIKQGFMQQVSTALSKGSTSKEALPRSEASTDGSFSRHPNALKKTNDMDGNIQSPHGFPYKSHLNNRSSNRGNFSGQPNAFSNSSNGWQRPNREGFHVNNQNKWQPEPRSHLESQKGPNPNQFMDRPGFCRRTQCDQKSPPFQMRRQNDRSISPVRRHNMHSSSTQNMSREESLGRQNCGGNRNCNGWAGMQRKSPPRNWSPPRNRGIPRNWSPPSNRGPSRNGSPPRNRGPPRNGSPPRNRGPPRNGSPPRNRGPPRNGSPPRNRGPPRNGSPPRNRGPPRNGSPPKNRGPPRNCSPPRNRSQPRNGSPSRRRSPPRNQSNFQRNNFIQCVYCLRDHPSNECREISMPGKRMNFLKKHNICFQCLGYHNTDDCQEMIERCRYCGNNNHNCSICFSSRRYN